MSSRSQLTRASCMNPVRVLFTSPQRRFSANNDKSHSKLALIDCYRKRIFSLCRWEDKDGPGGFQTSTLSGLPAINPSIQRIAVEFLENDTEGKHEKSSV